MQDYPDNTAAIQFPEDLPGAVGGAIVHHHNFMHQVHVLNPPQNFLDRFCFIVNRNDNCYFHTLDYIRAIPNHFPR